MGDSPLDTGGGVKLGLGIAGREIGGGGKGVWRLKWDVESSGGESGGGGGRSSSTSLDSSTSGSAKR
ncbi:MAG: hypothetical protein RLY93_09865 [Sumerlaeia bacterium]